MIFGRLDSKRGWWFGVMHRGHACDDQRYQRDMRRMTLDDAGGCNADAGVRLPQLVCQIAKSGQFICG